MSDSPHISRFTLERLGAGELADDAGLRAHLADCRPCRERAEAMSRDQAAFAQEVPYADFRVEHERRMARRASEGRRWWLTLAPALAAVALLLVWVLPEQPQPPHEIIKGAGVGLSLFDATGAPLPSGETLSPGSRVQLAYDAGPHTFLTLIGVDAAGNVTTYFPERGARLAPLPAGEQGSFPFGLELDDTAGIERFFLVLADQPEPLASVVAAARSIAHTDLQRTTSLQLPAGFTQTTVWLRKPEGP